MRTLVLRIWFTKNVPKETGKKSSKNNQFGQQINVVKKSKKIIARTEPIDPAAAFIKA